MYDAITNAAESNNWNANGNIFTYKYLVERDELDRTVRHSNIVC
jgi:hypothetical protein